MMMRETTRSTTRATEATAGTTVAAGCSSERFKLSVKALRRSTRECSDCRLLHFGFLRVAGNCSLASLASPEVYSTLV